MSTTTTVALVIALVVVALLLMLFGGGMTTGSIMSDGMMGSVSIGEIIWMWLPALLVVVMVGVLFSIDFRKK